MLTLQADLFAAGEPRLRSGAIIERTALDETCWIDRCDRFVEGGDELFAQLANSLPWRQGTRVMWKSVVAEPRLTTAMARNQHRVVDDAITLLDRHYGRPFQSIWCNYYRDGSDGVAWHGDRVKDHYQPTVAILSLGGPRRILYRPTGGGASTSVELASGDLFIMGGDMQRRWEHTIPKVAYAPPRISVTLRHERGPRSWAPSGPPRRGPNVAPNTHSRHTR